MSTGGPRRGTRSTVPPGTAVLRDRLIVEVLDEAQRERDRSVRAVGRAGASRAGSSVRS